jgi:putative restriction endonuclease
VPGGDRVAWPSGRFALERTPEQNRHYRALAAALDGVSRDWHRGKCRGYLLSWRPEFAPNIVQGKSFSLAEEPAASYFEEALRRLLGHDLGGDLETAWHLPGPVFGDPRLSPRRLGQRSFQAVVAGAYHRRCAITGDRIRPVLQAAHIRPVASGGEHRLDNGLLLRSDAHILLDAGYLGVDPKHRLMVSPRLRNEFGNGEEFYARAGQAIDLPDRRVDRPSREYLEWHLDEKYLAS